ncbi:MAG: MlaE family lipid ABC transporter permease subunit [Pseudomonadota bacterium]
MSAAAAGATLVHRADRVALVGDGDWTIDAMGRLDAQLQRLVRDLASGTAPVTIALSDVDRIDTSGAWLVHRTRRSLEAAGHPVNVQGLDHAQDVLVARVSESCFAKPLAPHPDMRWMRRELANLGDATLGVLDEITRLIGFLGAVSSAVALGLARPWRLRFTALQANIISTGLEALPIVGLMSFLIGMVLAFQGASQLTQFGAEIFTVNLLAISVLREIGVLMTAIIVAGRSGSAFTAQIGTMVVNEEVDAMRTLGLDPFEILVVPRVLALVIALPLLAFFANICGLVGGGLMCIFALGIPIDQFLEQLRSAASPTQLFVGLVKAPVFAFVIAVVGCRNGLRVQGDAASVGRLTTQAVVASIFLVIVIDAAFSIAFNFLGI